MAKVYVKAPGGLVGADGWLRLPCEGATVGEALADCVAKDPHLKAALFRQEGTLWVTVFVNGRNVRTLAEGMGSAVNEGDEILLVAPVHGG